MLFQTQNKNNHIGYAAIINEYFRHV